MGLTRNARDYYRTPAGVLDVVLDHIPRDLLVLDPCAGDGALLRPLRASGRQAWGMDIAPQSVGIFRGDFLGGALPPGCAPGCVVMNPPFSLAAEFVRRALGLRVPVFALLRLTWLEPCASRAGLLRAHTPDVYVLPFRPRFRADTRGSDTATCAWYAFPGEGRLHWPCQL